MKALKLDAEAGGNQTESFGLAAQIKTEGRSEDQTTEQDNLSALLQSISFLTNKLQETNEELIKIQNEKKTEIHKFNEKINVLAREKLTLQEEVTGLKQTITRQEASMKERKENKDLAAKKTAELEKNLKETKERLDFCSRNYQRRKPN